MGNGKRRVRPMSCDNIFPRSTSSFFFVFVCLKRFIRHRCWFSHWHHRDGAQMSSGDISYFNICNTLPVLQRYSCTLWDEVDESSIKNRGSVAVALPDPSSERFAIFISLYVKAHMLPPTAYSDLAAELTTFFVRAVMWHCRP